MSTEPMGSTMWTHILLQSFTWGLVFPLGMVLGLIHSRLHVPVQVVGTILAVVGYFLGHLHGGREFAYSAHAGFANWLMLLLIVQVVLGIYLRLHLEKGFLGRIRKYQVRAHSILGAVIPIAAWVQILFGAIATQGFCRGDHVGQCAAHFIMGSAFIAYGIVLTILLLLGQQALKKGGRSQEFYDSIIISVWGCINTFTEHRWGGPWVRNDLQHTSMGIIWWSAGLVGIWLSRDRQGRPRRNLIPGIVIILTGWAFGGHPQDLEVSTHVHSIFGYTLMLAGITRVIEISFILKDRTTIEVHSDGTGDEEINSFQYLPPFLLYASGFLFMGATEEQMAALARNNVTHVSYILLLYSVSFLLFLCKQSHLPFSTCYRLLRLYAVVLMLIHLYSSHAEPSKKPSRLGNTETAPRVNGHARVPGTADRQAHDAQEFELEGLMSEDEDTGGGAHPKKGAADARQS